MTQERIPGIRELRPTAQGVKGRRAEWHYRIHRHISIYITWVLLHTSLSANQVSLLSILSGLAGALLVLAADGWWVLLGLVWFYGYFLLDKVDGEVARFRGQQSLRGICLDYIGHMTIPPLLPLSTGGFLARKAPAGAFWLLGALAALSVMFLRAGQDIPYSLILRKLLVEPVLFKCAKVHTRNEPHAHKRKFDTVIAVLKAIQFLGTFWPSLCLLATALAVYLLSPSSLWVLVGTFLFVCSLQLASAGIMAFRLIHNIRKQVDLGIERIAQVVEAIDRG